MRKLREIDFLVKQFAIWFDYVSSVETYCWKANRTNQMSPTKSVQRLWFSSWLQASLH